MTPTPSSNEAPGPGALALRRAAAADLPAIAAIHKTAYSRNHFTAFLPERMLIDYYRAFLGGRSEICLAVETYADGVERIAGFSVHGLQIPEKIAAWKRQGAGGIVRTSIRHPLSAVKKIVRSGATRLKLKPPYPPADFLLLSIAVARPRLGLGKLLLREALAAAWRGGHARVGLYVNTDNLGAINAYCATGFRFKDLTTGQYYMEAESRAPGLVKGGAAG